MMKNADQQALLRKYEPVLKFNKGEKFFPVDIKAYVENSSLWCQKENQAPQCVIPKGQLTLENLGQPFPSGGELMYFLKFSEPLNLSRLAEYRIKQGLSREEREQAFHSGRGRLARVGYISRILDAIFSLTLFARGRVPGDAAAASALFYKELPENLRTNHYFGRIVKNDHWTVLQYWFFYPFNDWRTSFYGVNDHEADWESIFIYLYEDDDGELKPEWTAYSAHGYEGDDQRRRWDDPELEKVGEHPVIYVGAGSHGSYYSGGDYQIQIILSFLTPITRFFDSALHLLRRAFRMVNADVHPPDQLPILRIPFVDYARGDGFSVGPGQETSWDDPTVLDPLPDWTGEYRGLWGLYTKDPIAGEDAPAGPMFNRDGSIRKKWNNPAGWAGLEKVVPPNQIIPEIQKRTAELAGEIGQIRKSIFNLQSKLQTLQIEHSALQISRQPERLLDSTEDTILLLEQELAQAERDLNDREGLEEALNLHLLEVKAGIKPDVRAHLHHPHAPEKDEDHRKNHFGELWAAGSIGLLMIAFVLIINLVPHRLPEVALITGVSIILIEAVFWGYIHRVVSILSSLLALTAAGILVFQFFSEALQLGILLAGAYLLWENLREFFRR